MGYFARERSRGQCGKDLVGHYPMRKFPRLSEEEEGGDHRKGICRGGTDVQCRGRLAGDSTVGLVPGLAVAAVHTSASGMSGEVRVLLLPGEDHVHCT